MKINYIADALAIPFWIVLIYYMSHIQNKTIIEKILLLFGVIGFLADSLFVIKECNNIF